MYKNVVRWEKHLLNLHTVCSILDTDSGLEGPGGRGNSRMKEWFRSARLLSWITQFGLSIAVPLAGCILLAAWLKDRFALGGWVVALGVVLGLLGAVGGLISSIRQMDRQGAADQKRDAPGSRDNCFNGH